MEGFSEILRQALFDMGVDRTKEFMIAGGLWEGGTETYEGKPVILGNPLRDFGLKRWAINWIFVVPNKRAKGYFEIRQVFVQVQKSSDAHLTALPGARPAEGSSDEGEGNSRAELRNEQVVGSGDWAFVERTLRQLFELHEKPSPESSSAFKSIALDFPKPNSAKIVVTPMLKALNEIRGKRRSFAGLLGPFAMWERVGIDLAQTGATYNVSTNIKKELIIIRLVKLVRGNSRTSLAVGMADFKVQFPEDSPAIDSPVLANKTPKDIRLIWNDGHSWSLDYQAVTVPAGTDVKGEQPKEVIVWYHVKDEADHFTGQFALTIAQPEGKISKAVFYILSSLEATVKEALESQKEAIE